MFRGVDATVPHGMFNRWNFCGFPAENQGLFDVLGDILQQAMESPGCIGAATKMGASALSIGGHIDMYSIYICTVIYINIYI